MPEHPVPGAVDPHPGLGPGHRFMGPEVGHYRLQLCSGVLQFFLIKGGVAVPAQQQRPGGNHPIAGLLVPGVHGGTVLQGELVDPLSHRGRQVIGDLQPGNLEVTGEIGGLPIHRGRFSDLDMGDAGLQHLPELGGSHLHRRQSAVILQTGGQPLFGHLPRGQIGPKILAGQKGDIRPAPGPGRVGGQVTKTGLCIGVSIDIAAPQQVLAVAHRGGPGPGQNQRHQAAQGEEQPQQPGNLFSHHNALLVRIPVGRRKALRPDSSCGAPVQMMVSAWFSAISPPAPHSAR